MKRILLLLTGTIILIYFISAYFDINRNPVGLGSDGYEYWHLSTSLIEHHKLAYTKFENYPLFDLSRLNEKTILPDVLSCTVRVPGYPFILAVARHLWDSPWVAILINIVGYAGICLYGFRLCDLFIPAGRLRLIYDFLLVLNPLFFVRWGMGSDILAAFFLTGFTYHIIKVQASKPIRSSDVILACGLGICAVLTRSNLVIYCAVLLFGLILEGIIQKNRQGAFACVLILILLSASTGWWMQRNRSLTGTPTLSTQGGAVLYTVHLAYDLSPKDPLYFWQTDGKADLVHNAIRSGKTFNQAEAILDEKLKNVVSEYYKIHPMRFFKKLADGLRTIFFFSYFDISDAVMIAEHDLEDRMRFAHTSSSDLQSYSEKERIIRNKLFNMSRLYKWILAFSFFLFPIIWFARGWSRNNFATEYPVLYTALLSAIVTTALFTGAGGDRMRLPFIAVILLFCVLSAHGIFQRKTNN